MPRMRPSLDNVFALSATLLVVAVVAVVAACGSSSSSNNDGGPPASSCTDTMDTEQANIDSEFDPDGTKTINCAPTYEKQQQANWCAISNKTGFVRAGACGAFLIYELELMTDPANPHHTICYYSHEAGDSSTLQHPLVGIVYANSSKEKCAGDVDMVACEHGLPQYDLNESCTPVVDSGAGDAPSGD
jgi:hypothetical protein